MLLLEPWVHHMLVPLPAVFQGLRAWTWPSAKVKLVRTAAMALERPVDIVLAGADTAPQVGGAAVVVLGGEENPGRYRLLAKLQLTTPGKGCHPGMLRNYLADASCDSAVVHIRVPDYSAIIGSASTSCQVHGRFILLDNVTGYRSQYHKETFRISVR